MADEILLTAQPRSVIGKQVNAMRRSGLVPAVLYGSHLDKAVTLQVDEKTLKQVVSKAGHNRLIKLTMDGGEPRLVLAREVQRHSLSGRIVHVDFQEVSMTEKIMTVVPLTLVGTSPAVTRGEGLLIHGIDEVQIRVLATDLISTIQVDVSVLTSLNQSLTVADLKVSDKLEILTPRDEMVAKVVPVKEEVITEAVPTVAAEPEVISKGKKEEEEGAEGAVEGKPAEKK